MVNIFAREITDELTSLVSEINKKVNENSQKQLRAFLVLLTDDADAAESKLKALAKSQKVNSKAFPLTIFEGPAGPPRYKIAKDADVTVIMWDRRKTVKANFAFAKGKLDEKGVKKVAEGTSAILQ